MNRKDPLDAPRRARSNPISALAALLTLEGVASVAVCVIAAAAFTFGQEYLPWKRRGFEAGSSSAPPGSATATSVSAFERSVPVERVSEPPASPHFTFTVISDLHITSDGKVPRGLPLVITAVIATRPRFVAVTGDFTYGEPWDPLWKQRSAGSWWHQVRQILEPMRAAGIPVLPIAGNHDSNLPVYREAYASAWRDIDHWAEPLPVRGRRQPVGGAAVDAVPFTYATELDGVHLTFAHVVDEEIDPAVASWLRTDLSNAQAAALRIFFAHVPVAPVGTEPRREFPDDFRELLASGRVDVYVAGHEHLTWDEDFRLPGGASLRQVVVGTASGLWRFGPNAAARQRAGCVQEGRGARMRCRMPRQNVPFELRLEHGNWLEKEPRTFTVFTIDGQNVRTRTLAVDDHGAVSPFGGDDEATFSDTTAATTPGACPPDMVLVEGNACSDVRHTCLEWLDDPKLPYARCARYAHDPECVGTRTAMRFCIDRDELTLPGERLPASDLSFVKASAFCSSRGRRMCLESEWTFACEGEEMRPYPYGWERRAVCNQDRGDLLGSASRAPSMVDQRAPTDAFPECVSPFGVHDMVGNVDELVARDKPFDDHYRNLLKGGWWAPVRNRCRAATAGHDDHFHEVQIGARCCADAHDTPDESSARN